MISLLHSPYLFLYIGYCLGGCPILQYLHLSACGAPHTPFWMSCQMASRTLASLILLSALLCALCTSILYNQLNTLSLVASSMFSRVVTSLNISSVMSLPFSRPMNCYDNNLLGSLYSHSAIFVHSLSIHSWAELFLSLCSFWY